MSAKKSLVVVLVNGNINRIRALVSGLHLANYLGREVKFVWPFEKICLDDAQELFSVSFYEDLFINEKFNQVTKNFRNIKNGISDIAQDTVVIKGSNMGEQFYINKIYYSSKTFNAYSKIYIVSGGIFYPPHLTHSQNQLNDERKKFYRQLEFHPKIIQQVDIIKNQILENYIGLHLRYTDLVAQAPSHKSIVSTAKRISEQQNIKKFYICSDNIKNKSKIKQRLEKAGFEVSVNDRAKYKRGLPNANRSALIDWMMLASSSHLIHFGSSFSDEAIMYSGNKINNILIKSSKLRYNLLYPIQFFYVMIRKFKELNTLYARYRPTGR